MSSCLKIQGHKVKFRVSSTFSSKNRPQALMFWRQFASDNKACSAYLLSYIFSVMWSYCSVHLLYFYAVLYIMSYCVSHHFHEESIFHSNVYKLYEGLTNEPKAWQQYMLDKCPDASVLSGTNCVGREWLCCLFLPDCRWCDWISHLNTSKIIHISTKDRFHYSGFPSRLFFSPLHWNPLKFFPLS